MKGDTTAFPFQPSKRMTPQIRLAHEADSDGIVAVVSGYAQEKGTATDKTAVLSTIRACLNDPGCTVLVAELDGRVLGCLVAHWIPFPTLGGTECYISDLIVLASERGRGVGRQLVSAAEHRARELGCKRLMLNNSTAAESYKREFYPKLGFDLRNNFVNMVKLL